jgi:hypothetical protein
MKAIKINCINRTITEINVFGYTNICKQISDNCDTFICPAIFNNFDALYSDYFALIDKNEPGFLIDGCTYPIIGNGIIVGTDLNGNLTDVGLSVEDLQNKISFVSKSFISNWVYYDPYFNNSLFSKN